MKPALNEIVTKIKEFNHNFFQLLFDFIPPEFFGIASAIIAIGTFIISTILFSLGDKFSIFTVYVSNIPIGPHGSGIVFGIGMSISVFLWIPFIYSIGKWLWSENKTGNCFMILAGISGVIAFGSFIVLLFFDMKSAAMVHDLGSAGFFSFTFLMSLFLTISMEINDKASKRQWAFTSAILTVAIIFFPWYIYTISELMFPFRNISFDDWVNMMTSLDPKMDGVRYFEWIGILFSLAWLIQTGIHYHESRIKTQKMTSTLDIQAENEHQNKITLEDINKEEEAQLLPDTSPEIPTFD